MPLPLDCWGEVLAYPSTQYVVLRTLKGGAPIIFKEHVCKVNCVRFSADGSCLAAGDQAGTVHVFDPVTLKIKASFEKCMETVYDLAVKDDLLLVMGKGGALARLFNLTSQKALPPLPYLTKTVCGGCLLPGQKLVLGG